MTSRFTHTRGGSNTLLVYTRTRTRHVLLSPHTTSYKLTRCHQPLLLLMRLRSPPAPTQSANESWTQSSRPRVLYFIIHTAITIFISWAGPQQRSCTIYTLRLCCLRVLSKYEYRYTAASPWSVRVTMVVHAQTVCSPDTNVQLASGLWAAGWAMLCSRPCCY